MAININKQEGDKLHAEEWNELAQEVMGKQPRLNIVDDLNSDSSVDVLSAKQGKILDEKINSATSTIEGISEKVNKLPTGYYYGQFDSVSGLPDASQLTQKGYAYVASEDPSIYYIYLFDGEGSSWEDSGNKFVTTALEDDLSTKSESKAPTTKVVAESVENIDLISNVKTGSKELNTTQKYNANANISNRSAVVEDETGVVESLGYRVLSKNLRFAEQVTTDNTIYEVKDEFDLGGGSVTVPDGCTLKFNGGKLVNGTIIGTNTTVTNAQKSPILQSDIIVDGTWNNGNVYSEWVPLVSDNSAFDNRQMLRNLFTLCKSDKNTNLYIQNGVYYLNVLNETDYVGINVYSNTSVFAKGVELKALPNDSTRYAIMRLHNVKNVSIDGGIYTGDVEQHTGSSGEMGHGVTMTQSKNITLSNMVVQKCWGDGFYITNPYTFVEQGVTDGYNENVVIKNCKSISNRRQGISIEAVIGITIEDCEFANTGTIHGTSPMLGIDIEPYAEHQVVKDVIVRNCSIHDNGNTDYSMSIRHGTAPEYLEDNISIFNCDLDKGLQVKPINGLKIVNTKTLRIRADAQSTGTRTNEKLIFSISNSEISGNLSFINIKSDGEVRNSLVGSKSSNFLYLDQASSEADIRFYNCNIITGAAFQTPYIDTNVLLSKIGLHFYNCTIVGTITSAQNIGFRIAGDFVGNTVDVKGLDNTYTGYITLSAPGRKITIKGNTFLNVGVQKRLFFFIQTEDLSAIDPLYEIEANNFVGGTMSEQRIFFDYGGSPTKKIKSIGNTYPATAGYEQNPRTTITFVGDKFKIGNSIAYRNGSVFTDSNGLNINKVGSTSNRPSASTIAAGFQYYDTIINKPIFWNGNSWTDANGETVGLQVSDTSVLIGAAQDSSKIINVYSASTITAISQVIDETSVQYTTGNTADTVESTSYYAGSAINLNEGDIIRIDGTAVILNSSKDAVIAFTSGKSYIASGTETVYLATTTADTTIVYVKGNWLETSVGTASGSTYPVTLKALSANSTAPRGAKVIITNTDGEVVIINVVQSY